MNAKAAGKAAIHCACAAGNVDVLKVIMEFNPDVEVGVCIAMALHGTPLSLNYVCLFVFYTG